MATKLDTEFVKAIRKNHQDAVKAQQDSRLGFEALVNEVERLEALQEKKDAALKDLMAAYERRIRSDCTTPEQLEAKPWECAEFCQAREALK